MHANKYVIVPSVFLFLEKDEEFDEIGIVFRFEFFPEWSDIKSDLEFKVIQIYQLVRPFILYCEAGDSWPVTSNHHVSANRAIRQYYHNHYNGEAEPDCCSDLFFATEAEMGYLLGKEVVSFEECFLH
jgi:hypothetical protein